MEKLCSKCKVNPRRQSHKWCNECYNAWHRNWRNENKEDQQQKQRARYKKNPEPAKAASKVTKKRTRDLVLQAYGGKCSCCGELRKEFLCIDHIAGGGFQHRKEVGFGDSFYCWLKRNDYPTGFRVLCHNCNMSIGFYGYCPHQREKLVTDQENGRVGP